MKWLMYPLVITVSGLAAAGGCQGDGETGAGGATATTSTASSSSSTTTDSTTTTNTCGIDLVEDIGSTAGCNDCVAEHCCSEAQDFVANPDKDGQVALRLCALTSGCRVACNYLVCTTDTFADGLWLSLFANCATCMGTACCDETEACASDSVCEACHLGTGDTATCCTNPAFQADQACSATNCNEECAPFRLIECGAGGAGGSAGAGGGGGAGGS